MQHEKKMLVVKEMSALRPEISVNLREDLQRNELAPLVVLWVAKCKQKKRREYQNAFRKIFNQKKI
jgi:hypothetical protein